MKAIELTVLCLSFMGSFLQGLSKVTYSGLYHPDTSTGAAEWYSGAWLVHKQRLIDAKSRIENIASLEGATFSVIGHAKALMSRDYFDFNVLHLSSTTNQLPINSTIAFANTLKRRVTHIIHNYEMQYNMSLFRESLDDDIRLSKHTVAVIPFSSSSASLYEFHSYTSMNLKEWTEFQVTMRVLYFRMTFWSIHRYFPNIVVTVATEEDLKKLEYLQLPIWKTINMTPLFDPKAKMRQAGSTHFLPRESLVYVLHMLQSASHIQQPQQQQAHEVGKEAGAVGGLRGPAPTADSSWRHFQYVYYSEGDHVLQMRSCSDLFDIVDTAGLKFGFVPHRMQTIALPKAFSKYKDLWSNERLSSLRRVQLVTESSLQSTASCCDDGRFVFRDCQNWWYNCPSWGLSNYTTWVRFGTHGFTMPLGTEHQARCKYTAHYKTCPVPVDCAVRTPASAGQQFCGEMPNVERTWHL